MEGMLSANSLHDRYTERSKTISKVNKYVKNFSEIAEISEGGG